MDKTLQTKAWNCLPKEFKEEVNRMWSVEVDCATKYKSELHKHRTGLLYELFGEHLHWQNNLTSDAEGEEDEMLHVSRKKLQYFYEKLRKVGENHAAFALQSLFGSKCLPDENSSNIERLEKNGEVDSLESKFKAGDVAVIASEFKHPLLEQGGAIVTILSYHPNGDFYSCAIAPNVGIDVDAKYLEPYTEPKEDHIGENTEMVKDFDTILKDGFSKERRLNIAAMIMAAMMQNAKWGDKYSHIATMSCAAADALIAESEKGDTK